MTHTLYHRSILKKSSFMPLLISFLYLLLTQYVIVQASSSPTQTHYFKHQESNSTLPLSPALRCLTPMFLYHNQLYSSLKWILLLFFSLVYQYQLRYSSSHNVSQHNTSTCILLFSPLSVKTLSQLVWCIFSLYFLPH